jgi:Fur family ferric uptake transcriptional regulator
LIEDLQINAARNKGFVPLEHRLDVYGLCGNCARQPGQRLCLCDAEAGEFLCIRGLDGGDEMRRRMTDMGLNVGSEVEVLSSGGGPVVVVSKGSRLALGRGLSEKVLVEPVSKERKHGRGGLRFYRKLHRLRSRPKED